MTDPASPHKRWPDYLIAASAVTTALEYPGSILHSAIPPSTLRLALIGLAMGHHSAKIVHSPHG